MNTTPEIHEVPTPPAARAQPAPVPSLPTAADRVNGWLKAYAPPSTAIQADDKAPLPAWATRVLAARQARAAAITDGRMIPAGVLSPAALEAATAAVRIATAYAGRADLATAWAQSLIAGDEAGTIVLVPVAIPRYVQHADMPEHALPEMWEANTIEAFLLADALALLAAPDGPAAEMADRADESMAAAQKAFEVGEARHAEELRHNKIAEAERTRIRTLRELPDLTRASLVAAATFPAGSEARALLVKLAKASTGALPIAADAEIDELARTLAGQR